MYYQYFGLKEAPFSIAVDPRYLYMSARHREALAHLLYGVTVGGGFILLSGEVGTGKTTINRALLEQLPQDTDIAIILNPALNAMELLASACDELRIPYNQHHHTLKTLTDQLHMFLLRNHAAGRRTVLLIDEAQHLDFDVLEQIRLLTNLEVNTEKLLQIILIGQPELADLLRRPELRQLNQRITARYHLEPLNKEETGAYIRHRLQVAGMNPDREIFPPAVVRGIYKATGGIPRLINVLCDRMLLGAYGSNRSQVDRRMLRTAVSEVMGNVPEQSAGALSLPWLLGIATLLVALSGVGWVLWQKNTVPPATPTAAELAAPYSASEDVAAGGASSGRSQTSSSSTSHGTPALTDPQVVGTARTPASTTSVPVTASGSLPQAPVAAPAIGRSQVAVAEVASSPPSNQTAVELSADLSRALLSPGEGTLRLWPLYSTEPAPPGACPATVDRGVACVEAQADTWDDLQVFDRPLVLRLITPERFSAEVLFLGMSGGLASVWTPDGIISMTPSELAPLWQGRLRYLWHPPPGFQGPLRVGVTSPAVAEVAKMLARLDGQDQPLAWSFFNENLQSRVRLLQRQHGLTPDGVVGRQTLLKLNELLGIDPTIVRAKLALVGNAGRRE